MLKSITRDPYTIIIVALVPGLLLMAWGLTSWDNNRVHQQQCAVAEEWLNDSTALASRFERVETMDDIDVWISGFEQINSPSHSGQMRHGILSSARYHMEHYPTLGTSGRAVLNPPTGLFARDINEGLETLIEHCPHVESMVPAAFPMVFEEERPN